MKKIAIYLIVATPLLMAACNKDGRVTGVKIEPREVVLSLGESMVLTATVIPENADEQTVYWSTSYSDLVTVDDNGRITCIRGDWEEYSSWYKFGYVRIYALNKESAHEDECRVWFVDGGTLKLSETILTMSVGDKNPLTASVLERVNPFEIWNSNAPVTWSSNAPHIATVDPLTGEVTAVASGTATISAITQDGGRTATCTILVGAEILLSEDFENGFGTSLTGWTFDNRSFYNRWHVGTATANSGNQSCYISNNNSDNQYSLNRESNVRFYRELNIVSTAENPVIVSFYWKVQLWSSSDYAAFFVNGIEGFDAVILGESSTWQRREITLPTMSGTIQFGFEWNNNADYRYTDTAQGVAIDNIVVYRR